MHDDALLRGSPRRLRSCSMRTTLSLALSVPLLVALVLPAACRDERPACYEGDFAACSCPDGKAGYQACLPAEEGYGACVCDGTTPGLDGSFEDVADADAGPADKLPFMSKCTTDAECETGRCHLFSQQGAFCTKTCKEITDCPPPSSGCNTRGICKAP
jgi:hypothetical protein